MHARRRRENFEFPNTKCVGINDFYEIFFMFKSQFSQVVASYIENSMYDAHIDFSMYVARKQHTSNSMYHT